MSTCTSISLMRGLRTSRINSCWVFRTPAQSSSHVPTDVSNKGSRPETSIPIFSCVVLWSCRISSMDAIGLSRSTSGDLCLRVLSSSFRKTLENQDEPLKRSGLRWVFQTPAQSSSHVPTGVSNKGSRPETSIPIFSCVVLWSCRISSMDAIGLSRSTSGDLCLRVLSSSFRKTLENQDEPLKRSGLRWDWAPERTR